MAKGANTGELGGAGEEVNAIGERVGETTELPFLTVVEDAEDVDF